jgi:hypothetical protein
MQDDGLKEITLLLACQMCSNKHANFHRNYYYVFVGCSLFFLIMAYLYFPETRHKTLEEIAEVFGDKLVIADEQDVTEEASAEQKLGMVGERRVEHAA